ncbi:hypothetical protein GCM10008090_12050 [Arenicella chitinivorans]|uniref:Uncharacterized protein n=1 Tax=Arenicella chitinivorans TaxID=1329800 RepID=A0A918RMI4_9GAMM|nr:hypothetical protein [Arenicella chitinivorans]GHA04307.1 hypothetical protein GCM10008090_12050 [Arenicella chitinivorans]
MRRFFHYTAAWLVAVLGGSVTSSVFSSHFVLSELRAIDIPISFATQLKMTIDDFAILQTLGMAIGAAFLIAFIIAAVCHRFIGGAERLWFMVAGMSAVITLLLLMSWQLQLMPIAGARSNLGLLMQGVAGLVGGWLFWRLKPGRNAEIPS